MFMFTVIVTVFASLRGTVVLRVSGWHHFWYSLFYIFLVRIDYNFMRLNCQPDCKVGTGPG